MSHTWSVIAILAMCTSAGSSIRCYRCMPQRSEYVSEYENTKLCSVFDASEKYAVDCPDSTMCVQSELTLDMGNGYASNVSKRHCAQQTEKDAQVYIPGVGWRFVRPVHEIYPEGCTAERAGAKLTRSKVCYCRGDLCNGGGFGPVNAAARRPQYHNYQTTNVATTVGDRAEKERSRTSSAGSTVKLKLVFASVLGTAVILTR